VSWTTVLLILAALALGAAAGSRITEQTGRAHLGAGAVVPAIVASLSPAPDGQISFADGFAPVIGKVVPAVVNIASTKIVRMSETNSPFFSDPFFRQFFSDQFSQQYLIPKEQREMSLGSGVIISPDGYIITNNHVVEAASDIKISMVDKHDFKGRIVGTDPRTDIAALKVQASGLPKLALGDSSKVRVGNFLSAIESGLCRRRSERLIFLCRQATPVV